MDRRDLRVRQAQTRVELLDRRVVPGRDITEVDVRQHRPGEVELVSRDTGNVDDRRRGRECPGNLNAAVAAGTLALRQRSVAGAEIDIARGDLRDAPARPDRRVVDRFGLVELRPDGDGRPDERRAGAGQRSGRPLAGGAGAGGRERTNERRSDESKCDANELAVSRHLFLPPPQGSRPPYGALQGGWDTPPLRGGDEVVTGAGAYLEGS